jgi:hypothetical protein
MAGELEAKRLISIKEKVNPLNVEYKSNANNLISLLSQNGGVLVIDGKKFEVVEKKNHPSLTMKWLNNVIKERFHTWKSNEDCLADIKELRKNMPSKTLQSLKITNM